MNISAETKQCTNCKHDILLHNYIIHSSHCHQNFYLCSKCQSPVNLSQSFQHDTDNHAIINCLNCSLKCEKWLLNEHLQNECPKRKLKCQICFIDVEASDVEFHEDYCGSRTEKCIDCNEFVMLKYRTLHLNSNHDFFKFSDEPGPSGSRKNVKVLLSDFIPDFTSNENNINQIEKKKSKRKNLHKAKS